MVQEKDVEDNKTKKVCMCYKRETSVGGMQTHK
jgi:hypothetical protein